MTFDIHKRKNNTSGYPGVHFHSVKKKWEASITINNKRKWLGTTFDTLEAAITARKAAEYEIWPAKTSCAKGETPSHEYILEHYRFEPISGILFDLKNKKRAGYEDKTFRYRRICIAGKTYQEHRVIWFYMTGKWPKHIDHWNHNGLDNSWENLRDVTHVENHHNQSIKSNNTSGCTGVYQRSYGSFTAQIWVNGDVINLGTFDTFEEAVEARKAAELKYGFSPNHGKPKGEVSLHEQPQTTT